MLPAEARAALAIAHNELRIAVRYPLNAVNEVLQPLYQFLIPSLLLGAAFLVGGRAVGFEQTAGTDDLAGFLFLGVFVSGMVGAAFWGTAYAFKREMDAGTLEASYLTPTLPETLVIGRAISSFGIAIASGAILLGIGAVAFGAGTALAVVGSLPVLAIAAIGMVGAGYVVAAVVLRIKESNLIVDTGDFVFAVLSGVAFPVLVLPEPLRLVAMALPTTHALALMRTDALATTPLLPGPAAWLALGGLSLAWLLVGRWAFRRTDRALRIRGTIGEH